MSVASSGVALSPVGGAGGGGPPPRKMPPSTALGPATRFTVMVTMPPAATLIGTLTQAPCEKSVLILAAWGPEPSLTAMVSRRPAPSQSRSEEHTSELQSLRELGCRLLLVKKNQVAAF